jgi:hypothetical protein
MSDAMTAQATTKRTAKPRDPGAAPRSFGVRLADAAGAVLWIRAYRTRDAWRTEVVHRVGKKNVRGASHEHATLELARAAVDGLAATAAKAGWMRRESRGGGFRRAPDSFSAAALPKPRKK